MHMVQIPIEKEKKKRKKEPQRRHGEVKLKNIKCNKKIAKVFICQNPQCKRQRGDKSNKNNQQQQH